GLNCELRCNFPNQTEAIAVGVANRWITVTHGNAQQFHRLCSRSASHNMQGAGGWTSGIEYRTLRVIGTVPILDPLPDIALSVIKSPRIGSFLPDRMRHSTRVSAVPTNGIDGGI